MKGENAGLGVQDPESESEDAVLSASDPELKEGRAAPERKGEGLWVGRSGRSFFRMRP